MERQQLFAFQHGKCKFTVAILSHIRTISHLSRRSWFQHHRNYVLNISVHRVSAIYGLGCWKMQELCGDINPWSTYQPPVLSTMLSMTSTLYPKHGCQLSVNNLRHPIWENHGAMALHWSIIELSAGIPDTITYPMIITMSHNKHQHSFNDYWFSVMANLITMEYR